VHVTHARDPISDNERIGDIVTVHDVHVHVPQNWASDTRVGPRPGQLRQASVYGVLSSTTITRPVYPHCRQR
jgi:hypothetical protein